MASTAAKDPALAKNAIGLREVLFQSVTHMAPAAAVAFSIPAGAAYAARALPLAVVLALVACLFVAVSIGELAKHLPSAGGFYTYTSKALHPWVGFLVAWAYAGAEALIASFLFLNFSFVLADALNSEFGWTKDTWWIWVVATSLIVLALGYFGVRISTKAGTIMGAFEIVVFGLIAIWLIAKAGNANTLLGLHHQPCQCQGLCRNVGDRSPPGFTRCLPSRASSRRRRSLRRPVTRNVPSAWQSSSRACASGSSTSSPPTPPASRPSRATWPSSPLSATATLDLPGEGGMGSGMGRRPHRHLQLLPRQRERREQRHDAHLVCHGPHPLAAGDHGHCPPSLEVAALCRNGAVRRGGRTCLVARLSVRRVHRVAVHGDSCSPSF